LTEVKWMLPGLGAPILLGALFFPLAAHSQAQSEDTKNALKAQADRAGVIYRRGREAHYTKAFDLSGLPHYQPREVLTGWVRLHGNNYLSDGLLGELWQQGFAKFQPGIRLSYYLPTSALAFAALYYDQADLVMGHRPGFYDLLAYERVKNYDPTEIVAVTGSFDVGGWENSLTVLVNADNPIQCINLEQLDGIFGAERAGGWAGTNWRQDWARGPDGNIRTWGQLGLTGEWAGKPIDVYGFSIRYNTATDFSDRVLKGSDKWNEKIQAYGNIVNPDGSRYIEADQITDHIGRDKYAIGYNRYRGERKNVKRLAVAPGSSRACVEHTLENVQNRTYPLFNEQYFYVSVKPGTKMDPKVKEFLRYVLSQEGQADVMKDGKYLPLTAEVVRAQLGKLDEL
jgi:phosphate transport system substrate-binding protein